MPHICFATLGEEEAAVFHDSIFVTGAGADFDWDTFSPSGFDGGDGAGFHVGRDDAVTVTRVVITDLGSMPKSAFNAARTLAR